MDLIFLLLAFLIIVFVFNTCILNGDVLAPSSIFVEVFVFSVFCAALNKNSWNIKYRFDAFIIIFTGVLLFCVIGWAVKSSRKRPSVLSSSYLTKLHEIKIDRWKHFALIGVQVISLVWNWRTIVRISNYGTFFGGSILYNYRMITSYSNTLASDLGVPFILGQLLKISTAYSYIMMLVVLYNTVICNKKIRSQLIYLIPVAMFFVQSVMGAARSELLHLFSFSVTVWYIFRKHKSNWNARNSLRGIFKIGILVAIVLVVFYELSSVIGRTFSQLDFFKYMSIYTGGSIQHFNQYMGDRNIVNTFWGEETLANIYRFLWKLGIMDSYPIIHLEVRHLNNVLTGNVYTFFRRLIQDYGIIGMYILTALFSYIYSRWYYYKICYINISYKYLKTLLLYAYTLHLIYMASIEQTVFGYLSNNFVNTMIWMYFLFWFIMKFKIKFGYSVRRFENV